MSPWSGQSAVSLTIGSKSFRTLILRATNGESWVTTEILVKVLILRKTEITWKNRYIPSLRWKIQRGDSCVYQLNYDLHNETVLSPPRLPRGIKPYANVELSYPLTPFAKCSKNKLASGCETRSKCHERQKLSNIRLDWASEGDKQCFWHRKYLGKFLDLILLVLGINHNFYNFFSYHFWTEECNPSEVSVDCRILLSLYRKFKCVTNSHLK